MRTKKYKPVPKNTKKYEKIPNSMKKYEKKYQKEP